MIIYKSPDEIARMRVAGRITADAIKAMLDQVTPGMTTADLDAIAEGTIRDAGGIPSFLGYKGTYPATICASVNDEIVHGIPSATRVLKTGDVLSLDCGAIWEGFQGDSAVTVIVGDQPPSPEADKLVRVTEDALDAAVDAIRPGGRLSDIGATIQQVAEGAGFTLVREYGGHGIGRAMHEDPFIQNFGSPGRGPELKPGLVIAVEPMVMLGSHETKVQADGWTVVTADGTLAAQFEHTVAVTEDGHEILTSRAIEASRPPRTAVRGRTE
jgi:methionyl aminopeptidase